MDSWLREHLVCPRDHGALREEGDTLVCPAGHAYPCVGGIPVMLLSDVPPTHVAFHETLSRVGDAAAPGGRAATGRAAAGGVDPFVQDAVAGTCGNMYRRLVGRLTEYPIPDVRLPPGGGRVFLDVGCNWGRWCVSAARKGYRAVGVDPSLEAIEAARRVAHQLGAAAIYVVADARHLPFRAGSFDVAFSYSVLQHFDKGDARKALAEIGRVLGASGISIIQMPNAFGLRNLYHQARRGFRRTRAFEVRYWSPRELRRVFARAIGPTSLFADGYFSLNPQASDQELLPPPFRYVVYCSELIRHLSERLPWLVLGADSLYVRSRRREDGSA
ncbi:MAG TPA: methyltransferase domain-containing protein [bacterium]|nr:methyltransferase domain-containing protein [bacterium]